MISAEYNKSRSELKCGAFECHSSIAIVLSIMKNLLKLESCEPCTNSCTSHSYGALGKVSVASRSIS